MLKLLMLLLAVPPIPDAVSQRVMVREPQIGPSQPENVMLPPTMLHHCINAQEEQAALQQKRELKDMQCLPSLQAEAAVAHER